MTSTRRQRTTVRSLVEGGKRQTLVASGACGILCRRISYQAFGPERWQCVNCGWFALRPELHGIQTEKKSCPIKWMCL